MHGRITKFSAKDGFGVIEADDGSRYRFAEAEVVNLNGKLVGHSVDFLLNDRRPKDIILMTGTPWSVFCGTRH
ncbi:MAG: hypothetical protein ACK4TP_02710 [Hyphomicrobium sp.]|jgi:cold shock CspA family protein